jgi:phage/plasmid-associated DNA primase
MADFEFTKAAPVTTKNVNLAEDILVAEREAIVAWALAAKGRLDVNNRYTEAASQDRIIEEVLEGQDSVYFFIQKSSRVVIPSKKIVGIAGDLTSSVTFLTPLLEEYRNYTVQQGGARPVGRGMFYTQMKSLAQRFGLKVVLPDSENGYRESGFSGLMILPVSGGRMKVL